MSEMTSAEKKILKGIKSTELKTSLGLIRATVEKIWALDAPRIIQDYTDHGISHCERISKWIVELLQAGGKTRLLSEYESYVLLAGVYLHDIGMQCDVVKFPEILKIAEKIGARFDMDFVAKSSNSFSPEESKSLRKNHHYLSCAWIEHALTDKTNILANAVSTIPRKLLSDLIDVCKFHSKLAIAKCHTTFNLYDNERKQLVAAMLRLADELDVDCHRVTIEVVNAFSISPLNSVYWWLHQHTTITFPVSAAVVIKVVLHPDDAKQFASLVKVVFIEEFRSKNRALFDILRTHQYPVFISADSEIIEDRHAEKFPREIVQAFQLLSKKEPPLNELVYEVQSWLRAIRYEVTDAETVRNFNMVKEFTASLSIGSIKQNILVRCVDREVNATDVESLENSLSRLMPEGWLISDQRVSTEARSLLQNDSGVEVFTLGEFLRKKIWGSYMTALSLSVEDSNIRKLYVDLACYKEEWNPKKRNSRKVKLGSLDEYIDSWLKERGKMHISLLGEFGSGKTWFCRHYADRQMKRYEKDPVSERMPLLITLRAFSKAMDAKQLLNDALLEQYQLPFVGSAYDVFLDLSRKGKLLLILDGFDEMARQVDYQTVVDNFWELANLVTENSKVILTSRTEYFRWAEESTKILGGEEYGRRKIVLEPPKFEVLNVESMDEERIRQVIVKRKGSVSGNAIADRILKANGLADMAKKPILVELLLAALDEVKTDALENSAHVYLYATNRLLLRNIETKRTFTQTADKLYFLCELAWEMIHSGELAIHYKSIPDRIGTYFGSKVKGQHELDCWDFDLRNQTMLHRNSLGYYEFAHKSLAEYFVALKFAAELGCLENEFQNTYREDDKQPCAVPFEQLETSALASTFGAIPLADARMAAVRDFLRTMLVKQPQQQLWKIMDSTRRGGMEVFGYSGGNAATLLNDLGASFCSRDLSNTCLAAADLRSCHLSQTKLHLCDLRGANLSSAWFSKKEISSALCGDRTKFTIFLWSKSKITGTEIMDLLNSSGSKIYSIMGRSYSKEKISVFAVNLEVKNFSDLNGAAAVLRNSRKFENVAVFESSLKKIFGKIKRLGSNAIWG